MMLFPTSVRGMECSCYSRNDKGTLQYEQLSELAVLNRRGGMFACLLIVRVEKVDDVYTSSSELGFFLLIEIFSSL